MRWQKSAREEDVLDHLHCIAWLLGCVEKKFELRVVIGGILNDLTVIS